jgi:hypothetical protein
MAVNGLAGYAVGSKLGKPKEIAAASAVLGLPGMALAILYLKSQGGVQ